MFSIFLKISKLPIINLSIYLNIENNLKLWTVTLQAQKQI